MLSTKPKTKEEIEGATEDVPMTVLAYNDQFMLGSPTLWHCSECHILFEPKDFIIARILHGNKADSPPRCPMFRTVIRRVGLFRKKKIEGKKCLSRLWCGRRSEWETKNHLSPVPPPPEYAKEEKELDARSDQGADQED